VRRVVSIAIPAGGAILLVAHALRMRALFHGNSFDDAYIAYRYAENWARGLGPVFNPGERVEGYSNFLWVALLAPVARLGGNLVIVSQLAGLACSVGSLVLAIVALRRVLGAGHTAAETFVALLLAGSGYVAAWAVGGLEGPLFGLLLLAAWMAAAARRTITAALCFAALALVRPEGMVIALAVAAAAGLAFRRPAARRAAWIAVVVVVVAAAYEIWRLAYYGPHLVPNAVRAKVGFTGAQVVRGVVYAAKQFLVPYAPLLLPALLPRTWRGLDPQVRRALAGGTALWLAALLLVVVTGGDWSQGRFFAPLLPLATTVAAGWGVHVGRRMLPIGWARAGGVALAVYLVAAFWVTGPQREAAIRRRYAPADAERIAIGKWLATHMPADVVIAVRAAGEIPYYSRLPTHDMLGLNDPHIASLRVAEFGRGDPGHEKFDPDYTLRTVRPGIIVDARLIPGMQRHAIYRSAYYNLADFWTLHELSIRSDLAVKLGLVPNAGH
jgi:arabinofuranosyltransferase